MVRESDEESRQREGTRSGSGRGHAESDRLSHLLAELSEKVREAGIEGVRILTEDEVQRDQLLWFRSGWEEHARAMEPELPDPGTHPEDRPGEHPGDGPGLLLRFPDGGGRRPGHPLPIVGAGDASVRELMPHRPRARTRDTGPATRMTERDG
ncbi:hypothetical protein [Streptomyces sp. NPDC014894]|uniref:hypothetical protein n=1 Tax=unclassified Streptomyces TaxID=2593676 RepID=UPI003703663D